MLPKLCAHCNKRSPHKSSLNRHTKTVRNHYVQPPVDDSLRQNGGIGRETNSHPTPIQIVMKVLSRIKENENRLPEPISMLKLNSIPLTPDEGIAITKLKNNVESKMNDQSKKIKLRRNILYDLINAANIFDYLKTVTEKLNHKRQTLTNEEQQRMKGIVKFNLNISASSQPLKVNERQHTSKNWRWRPQGK